MMTCATTMTGTMLGAKMIMNKEHLTTNYTSNHKSIEQQQKEKKLDALSKFLSTSPFATDKIIMKVDTL